MGFEIATKKGKNSKNEQRRQFIPATDAHGSAEILRAAGSGCNGRA